MLDNAKVIYLDLPTTIGGFVKKTDDFYTIVLNSRLSYDRNRESYMDEIDHIVSDAMDQDIHADQIELQSHRGKL